MIDRMIDLLITRPLLRFLQWRDERRAMRLYASPVGIHMRRFETTRSIRARMDAVIYRGKWQR